MIVNWKIGLLLVMALSQIQGKTADKNLVTEEHSYGLEEITALEMRQAIKIQQDRKGTILEKTTWKPSQFIKDMKLNQEIVIPEKATPIKNVDQPLKLQQSLDQQVQSLNQQQLFIIQVATMIAASLTLLGSVYMNTSLFLEKPFLYGSRTDQKLLYLMASASIGGAFALIQNQQVLDKPVLCQIQAIFIQLAASCLPFLNACQSFNFYYILSGYQKGKKDNFVWIYVGICLLFPIGSISFLLSEHALGPAFIWCWILHDRPDLRYGLFFIPLWTCIIVGVIFTFLGVRKVWIVERKALKCTSQPTLKSYQHTRAASKAFLFGLVFVIVWIPGTLDRIYERLYGASPFFLVLLHCFFTPIQGFLNALVYWYFQKSKRKGTPSLKSQKGSSTPSTTEDFDSDTELNEYD